MDFAGEGVLDTESARLAEALSASERELAEVSAHAHEQGARLVATEEELRVARARLAFLEAQVRELSARLRSLAAGSRAAGAGAGREPPGAAGFVRRAVRRARTQTRRVEPDAAPRVSDEERALVMESGLFDESLYRREANLAGWDGSALDHLLAQADPLAAPHVLFDPGYYSAQPAAGAAREVNPLVSFLRGRQPFASPHPLFDSSYYLSRLPPEEREAVNPLVHFLRVGAAERRDPHPWFSTGFYVTTQVPGLDPAELNPLVHYLLFGAGEGLDPHPRFSTGRYLADNQDVQRSGVNPLVHFVTVGRYEGRAVHPSSPAQPLVAVEHELVDGLAPGYPRRRLTAEEPRPLRIAYVSGRVHRAGEGGGRVPDQVEALTALGHAAYQLSLPSLTENLTRLAFADVVVFHGVPWSQEVEDAVVRIRRAGGVVVVDLAEPAPDRLLAEADLALTTSPFLSQEAERSGTTAAHVPEGFGRDFLRATERAAAARRARSDATIRIGWIAGEAASERDLGVAAQGLRGALEGNPEVILSLVGADGVSLPPELHSFAARIERRAPVSPERLPSELARLDVSIVPLEVGNRSSESRSERAWFEAALAGVPTVASPTAAFAQAIANGRTGFLARSEGEWKDALTALVADPGLRKAVAARARAVALERYGEAAREAKADEWVGAALTRRKGSGRRRRDPQTVTVVLPEISPGSGGAGNVMRLSRELSRRGLSVHVVVAGTTDASLPAALAKAYGLAHDQVEVSIGQRPFARSDVAVATFWTTVGPVAEALEDGALGVHFVQDDEALFYPMGWEYLGARKALDRGFHRITLGAWLAGRLREQGLESDAMPFPLDHDLYHCRPDERRDDDHVVFFARPGMPRRLFELGVEALRRLSASHPAVRVSLYGSNESERPGLPAAWRHLGVCSPADTAALYRSATIGLAFSPTNPSSVPYEMMACGLPVVDLDLEDTPERYGSRETVIGVGIEPDGVAAALGRALDDEGLRDRTREAGLKLVAAFPSWPEAAAAFHGSIGRALERGRA